MICQDKVEINSNLTANLMTFNMLYFFAGYYFEKRISEKDLSKHNAICMCIIGFISVAITCFMTQYRIGFVGLDNEKDVEAFFMYLTAFPTFAIYYCNRLFWRDHNLKFFVKKLILACGNTAFGVMLIENLVRHALDFMYRGCRLLLPEMLSCIIWVLSVWIVASAAIYIVKKIPICRRLL